MKVVSLFTGAGGLDLGLHQVSLFYKINNQRHGCSYDCDKWTCFSTQSPCSQAGFIPVLLVVHCSLQAGHEIILQCECDPGAQQVRLLGLPVTGGSTVSKDTRQLCTLGSCGSCLTGTTIKL